MHNRYHSGVPSGENQVVDFEIEALRAAGVDVISYIRSSDEIDAMGLRKKLGVPFQPIHSSQSVSQVIALVQQHRPDVLHLHNPYPLISLSVVRAAHHNGVPVIQTVHNHRHSCVRGSYFRDGHSCLECEQKKLPWPAVVHGCYRDSRLQSAVMVTALRAHRRDQSSVDQYIALSESIAQSLGASGWVEPGRIIVRPNSVPDPGPPSPAGTGLLFIGRLTEEKGVPLLIEAWRRSNKTFGTLTFVGEGPARAMVQAEADRPESRVVYVGRLDGEGVSSALSASAALVVPSTAPEALPLVVLEAFAHGRPVLASNSGGLASVVDSSVGWLSTTSATALAGTLDLAGAADDLVGLGRSARHRYETQFAPSVVIAQQIQIYRDVIAEAARTRAEDQ